MNERIIEKRIAWVKSFESGERWLDGVSADHSGSEHTLRNYARSLFDFSAWVKKSPDEMITERKENLKSPDEATKHKFEEVVRRYRLYLQRERKVRTQGVMTALFSFFKYNYCKLEGKIPLDDYTPYKPLSLDEIRRADTTANLGTRCIIRFLLDSGMSREDVVAINFGDIQAEFESGKDVILIAAKRRKENLHYTTFVGSNFLSTYRQYKAVLEKKGVKFTKETPLLCGLQGQRYSPQQITLMLNNLSKKLDFAISPHRVRKTFETLLSMAKVHPTTLKAWMGHKVRGRSDIESRYILPSPEEQRKMYAESYNAINLTASIDLAKRAEVSERLMNKIVAGAPFNDEDRRDIKAYGIQLREATSRRRKTPKCDGETCQKIIEENTLETMLSEGWHFVSALPSGKIVVAND